MPRMKSALLLVAALAAGAHATDKPVAAPPTDLALGVVRLDPPDGSTLKAGEMVTATLEWRYSKPATHLPLWVKLEVPDSVDWSYDGDHDETRPGHGRLDRYVGLNQPGHLDALVLVAKDANSREIYRRVVKVNYTFVANPVQEALRRDGLGSRITGVTFDPPPPARLAPGTRVIAHIGYAAKSIHGVRPVAIPVTACPMTYNGLVQAVDGRGEFDQNFTVGTACALRQVRVQLFNEGGAVVDEKLVDIDLRFGP